MDRECECWSGRCLLFLWESLFQTTAFLSDCLKTDAQNLLKGFCVMCFFNEPLRPTLLKGFGGVFVLTGFCFILAHHMHFALCQLVTFILNFSLLHISKVALLQECQQ